MSTEPGLVMGEDQGNPAQTKGALIRAAADGELSPEQQAAWRALCAASPDAEQRVEFERALRGAVARSMTPTDRAPAALRERIGAMAEETAGDRPLRLAEENTRANWAGRAARALAVAAVLTLGVIAAFFAGRVSAPGGGSGETYAAQAASLVSGEHDHCLRDEVYADRKFALVNPSELPAAMRSIVGRDDVLDLVRLGQVHFLDAGKCKLPEGSSMHVRFSTEDDTGNTHVASLFLQRDTGRLALEQDKSFRLTGNPAFCSPCVFVWRTGGVVYWLVCDRSEGNAMRSALAAPQLSPDPL